MEFHWQKWRPKNFNFLNWNFLVILIKNGRLPPIVIRFKNEYNGLKLGVLPDAKVVVFGQKPQKFDYSNSKGQKLAKMANFWPIWKVILAFRNEFVSFQFKSVQNLKSLSRGWLIVNNWGESLPKPYFGDTREAKYGFTLGGNFL